MARIQDRHIICFCYGIYAMHKSHKFFFNIDVLLTMCGKQNIFLRFKLQFFNNLACIDFVYYYGLLRKAILGDSIREANREARENELDESHFGANLICGKHGRGARAMSMESRTSGVLRNSTVAIPTFLCYA